MRASIVTLIRSVVVLLALAGARPAAAQNCHTPALRESDGASYRVNATGVFATYSNASYTGEYQGAYLRASYLHPRVAVELALPYYRLVRNGLTLHGVGDLQGDARVVAYQTADGALRVGPEFAITVPTGDEAHDLGMGHVMLMPGGWLSFEQGAFSMILQVAYGRAATSLNMSGHHHEAVFPLVNPMNMQELEHALGLSYRLHPNLALDARVLGAVPIDAPMGTTREILAGGVRVIASVVDVGLEVQVPVVGAVFQTRTLLSLAAQW